MTPNLKFVDGTTKSVPVVGVATPRTKKRADVRSVVLCNIGISRRRVEGADRKRPGHNLDLPRCWVCFYPKQGSLKGPAFKRKWEYFVCIRDWSRMDS